MKTCSKCQNLLEKSNFRCHKNTKDGLDCWCKNCHKEYRAKNKEKIDKIHAKYRLKNRDKIRERNAKWQKNNSNIYNYLHANIRAKKRKAIPKWANLKEIKEFYKNCPKGYHVDHIIPLNGKIISGFHVIDNLQYLPAMENIRKGNRYASQGR